MSDFKPLHFSIEGDFITRLAREKLYYNDDLFGAVELLLSCLQTDEISDAERLSLAVKILNGKMRITGTYPEPNYRVEKCEPKDGKTIKSWLTKFQEKLRAAENSRDLLLRQMVCVSEQLSDYEKRDINDEWKNSYRHKDDASKIFDDIEDTSDFPSLFEAMGFENDPVADFLNHIQNERNDDYGWLAPDGTFHSVDQGEHQSWAYMWLKDHNPTAISDDIYDIDKAGDVLIQKGWILLHNPTRGTAHVTQDETKHITKAQREYLYDYFTQRNRPDLALKYFELS